MLKLNLDFGEREAFAYYLEEVHSLEIEALSTRSYSEQADMYARFTQYQQQKDLELRVLQAQMAVAGRNN